MSFTPKNPLYLEQQYEALRREALDLRGGPERGHGLALFLSQGMAAWMAALSALRPPQAASASEACSSPRCPEPAHSARSDLATLLAGMVLACTQGVHHE